MPQASSEILIKCPREELYAFLADPENDPKWRSGVLDLKRVSGSGIGARYTQGVRGPGGRRILAAIEITELTPDKSIAFQTVTGPVRPAAATCSSTATAERACASNSKPT
jgi:uncharacterized protein YndB with AHSA1/START domain